MFGGVLTLYEMGKINFFGISSKDRDLQSSDTLDDLLDTCEAERGDGDNVQAS